MKSNHFTSKKKLLKKLTNQLQKELELTGSELNERVNKLIVKIKLLLQELAGIFAKRELIRILGAAAVFVGILSTQQVSAQSFAPVVKSPFNISKIDDNGYPGLADLDGDGDFDLLIGEGGGGFRYYQNTGTANSPAFGNGVSNPFGLNFPNILNYSNYTAIAFADLDADGDIDLLIGTGDFADYSDMYYFKNTGTPTNPQFAAPVANPFGLTAPSFYTFPTFTDLDNDGDFDLLVGQYGGDVLFYRNVGSATNPSFTTAVTNPFGLTSNGTNWATPTFADLDGDGDDDLLVGEYYYNCNLKYFKNNGSSTSPSFSSIVAPTGLTSSFNFQAFVAAADMDDDGDVDLIVAEFSDELLYFQNRAINVGLTESSVSSASLYPNPTVDFIEVASEKNISSYEVYNASGILVQAETYTGQKISVKELPVGFYSINLYSNNAASVSLKFTKS